MSEKAEGTKVVPLNHPAPLDGATESFSVGQTVYLTQAYYDDHNTTIVEVPKFDWLVTGIINDVIQIQYQRKNLKLLTVLMVDKRYLKILV